MQQCPHCDKKMPKHILPKHIAKRHESLAGQVLLPESANTERWDFQKTEKCATCGQEHPAILMRYHAHVYHGV